MRPASDFGPPADFVAVRRPRTVETALELALVRMNAGGWERTAEDLDTDTGVVCDIAAISSELSNTWAWSAAAAAPEPPPEVDEDAGLDVLEALASLFLVRRGFRVTAATLTTAPGPDDEPIPPVEARRFRLYVFDVDGTLRRWLVTHDAAHRDPTLTPRWELMPNVRERLARIDWHRSSFALLTNQDAVRRGLLTQEKASLLLNDLEDAIWPVDDPRRPRLMARFVCWHSADDGCTCRKPRPDGLLALAGRGPKEWPGFALEDVLFVGNRESDAECARRAGVAFMSARDFFK